MRRHWEYFKYVIRHKWFVFRACLKLGVPLWIAIIHDWDKFLPDEWFPYARCFYAPNGSKQYDEKQMVTAWNAHQKRNKHHWQYWMLTWDRGETQCLPMPDVYRREMLADWIGAGMAHGKTNTIEWYANNRDKMKLHIDTLKWLDNQLGFHRYMVENFVESKQVRTEL